MVDKHFRSITDGLGWMLVTRSKQVHEASAVLEMYFLVEDGVQDNLRAAHESFEARISQQGKYNKLSVTNLYC